MISGRNNRKQANTEYIQLDTTKCEACWKCLEACKSNVIGSINLPWHKHTQIVNKDNCIGCLKCTKVCAHEALTKISPTNNRIVGNKKKNPSNRLMINAGLLVIGLLVTFSGFLIQFSYHMGHHGKIDFTNTVLNINYFGWSTIHKVSIVLLSVFGIFHIVQHWAWYKAIIKKNLIPKNKQVFILSAVFFFVAITGYIPWIVDLFGNDETTRKFFLETHDKLTIILFLFLILHVTKRFNWFMTTSKRTKK